MNVSAVAAADGGTGGSGSIRIGFLAGDVNQNRVVTLSDLGLVNAQLSQPVSAANFLHDVNASGTLTVADKGMANTMLATQSADAGQHAAGRQCRARASVSHRASWSISTAAPAPTPTSTR